MIDLAISASSDLEFQVVNGGKTLGRVSVVPKQSFESSYVLRYARPLKRHSVYQVKVGGKGELKSSNKFSISNNVSSTGKREAIVASSLINGTQNIKN
jgi:hypothetical protein